MKLMSFMTLYKVKKTDEEKLDLIRSHIKNEYVPYEKKADIAQAIVRSSYWHKEKLYDESEHDVLHVDSVARYMLTCMAAVELYTDFELPKGDGKMLENFNILNGSGVLDKILSLINERELKEFNMVINMTCEDLMTNEYENHAFISKQVERFGELLSVVLSPVLSSLDLNQVQQIIDKFK